MSEVAVRKTEKSLRKASQGNRSAPLRGNWKSEAAQIINNDIKLCHAQWFLDRLDAPDMDLVAKKIGPGHLVSALLIGYDQIQGGQPPPAPTPQILTYAYGMRSAAKKGRELANFARKWEKALPGSTLPSRNGAKIAFDDFAFFLDAFSQHMDDEVENAKGRGGGPKQTPHGYQLGNIIVPGQPPRARRPDPKSWELVICLINYFEANKLGPLYGVVAILCSAILRRGYTDDAINKIYIRIKKKSPALVINLPPGVKTINAEEVVPPWTPRGT